MSASGRCGRARPTAPTQAPAAQIGTQTNVVSSPAAALWMPVRLRNRGSWLARGTTTGPPGLDDAADDALADAIADALRGLPADAGGGRDGQIRPRRPRASAISPLRADTASATCSRARARAVFRFGAALSTGPSDSRAERWSLSARTATCLDMRPTAYAETAPVWPAIRCP